MNDTQPSTPALTSLAARVQRCLEPRPTPAALDWTQSFNDHTTPLVDGDYLAALSQTVSWLASLVSRRESDPFAEFPACIGSILEAGFVGLNLLQPRDSHSEACWGVLGRDSARLLFQRKDYAWDTGISSRAWLEETSEALLCVPIRLSSAPRVLAVVTCVRTGAAFTSQDARFVAQAGSVLVTLEEGSAAPKPGVRLCPSRRATREVRAPRPAAAQPRGKPLVTERLFQPAG